LDYYYYIVETEILKNTFDSYLVNIKHVIVRFTMYFNVVFVYF